MNPPLLNKVRISILHTNIQIQFTRNLNMVIAILQHLTDLSLSPISWFIFDYERSIAETNFSILHLYVALSVV